MSFADESMRTLKNLLADEDTALTLLVFVPAALIAAGVVLTLVAIAATS